MNTTINSNWIIFLDINYKFIQSLIQYIFKSIIFGFHQEGSQ